MLNFSPAIRARYCYFGDCGVVEEYGVGGSGKGVGEDYEGFEGENKKKFNRNMQENGGNKGNASNASHLHGGVSHFSPPQSSTPVAPSTLTNSLTE